MEKICSVLLPTSEITEIETIQELHAVLHNLVIRDGVNTFFFYSIKGYNLLAWNILYELKKQFKIKIILNIYSKFICDNINDFYSKALINAFDKIESISIEKNYIYDDAIIKDLIHICDYAIFYSVCPMYNLAKKEGKTVFFIQKKINNLLLKHIV